MYNNRFNFFEFIHLLLYFSLLDSSAADTLSRARSIDYGTTVQSSCIRMQGWGKSTTHVQMVSKVSEHVFKCVSKVDDRINDANANKSENCALFYLYSPNNNKSIACSNLNLYGDLYRRFPAKQ